MEVRPPLSRSALAYHSRTRAGVSARKGTSSKGGRVQPQVPLAGLPIPRTYLRMIPQPHTCVAAARLPAETFVQPVSRAMSAWTAVSHRFASVLVSCGRRRLPHPRGLTKEA
jgi:hypothetical protein